MIHTPAKQSRLDRATEILKLSSAGMSISAACKQVRMSRSTFYEICKNEPEILQDLQEQIATTNREQLAMILTARGEALKKLINQSMADKTKPSERLAIFKELERHLDQLVQSIRLSGGNEEAAWEVLSGPILVQSESRFTSISA